MKLDKMQYRALVSDFYRDRMLDEGFKKITLDELTENLAISKKTVYKLFPTKEALCRSILIDELDVVYKEMKLLIEEKNTMVERMEKLSGTIEKYIQLFNEESLQNLKKEFPNLWKETIDLGKERLMPLINLLLEDFQKRNLIIGYPNELIIKLFSTSLTLSNEKKYIIHNQASSQSVFQSIFEILLKGIVTEKGKKLLAINKRMKNENN